MAAIYFGGKVLVSKLDRLRKDYSYQTQFQRKQFVFFIRQGWPAGAIKTAQNKRNADPKKQTRLMCVFRRNAFEFKIC